MLYNPFMPSVRLNNRITFGGGGGDAPAPVVAPPPVAVTPPPPPPPEFTSTYPELANQRFSTEEAKTTAEATIDKQKTDASTAVTGATQYAQDVGNDVNTASRNVQSKISTLQLELNNLLTADQANPQIAAVRRLFNSN